MHYDVSPNDKRWPSMSLRVARLTSSRGPQICPGTRLHDSPSLCPEGTNILLLISTPVRTNQLHAMRSVFFSWNPYHRAVIPIETRSSSLEFKFLTREKNFLKINIPTHCLWPLSVFDRSSDFLFICHWKYTIALYCTILKLFNVEEYCDLKN